MKEEEIHQAIIEDFSPRGYGVAHVAPSEGRAMEVEVAHTVVGDTVRFEMRRKMKPPRKGRLLEVISPSADRTEPRCSHAQICGGCCWQQMAYVAQLKRKEALVADLFKRPVAPIIACENPFEYRNKMEFSFSENRAGQKFLGLMIAQAEPYVFNVERCHLCKGCFSDVLSATRSWWEQSGVLAYHPARDEGTLRYLTLREATRTGQKMIVLNIAGRSELSMEKMREHLYEGFLKAVQDVLGDAASVFLRIHEANRGKPTQFREVHLAGPDHIVERLHLGEKKLSFKISPSSFFQPNTLQAEKLYEAALSQIAHFKGPVVYDLYSGAGTLSLTASFFASKVVGIELSQDAVQDAKRNAALNQIENISFYAGDVGKTLTELMAGPLFQRPDVVIVDPPRAGLDALALHHLLTLRPKGILYISCNPATQVSNVEELTKAGYSIRSLQPVDQFPHTYHIENIAYLER